MGKRRKRKKKRRRNNMFTKKHRTSHTDWTDKEVNLTSLWTYTDQLRGQTQRFQPDATCVTLSWMVHSSPMDSISHERLKTILYTTHTKTILNMWFITV